MTIAARRWSPLFVAFAVCSLSGAAAAHPVSVSRALVFVDRGEVTVDVQVFLEDLYLFHRLQTDGRDYLPVGEIRRGIEHHRQFVSDRFQVLDVRGRTMSPIHTELTEWSPPEDGVPLAELMSHQLTFSLQFEPLTQPPEFLTFLQRFSESDAVLPSEMTLRVQQAGEADAEPIPLVPHEPHTVQFVWPDSDDAGEESREVWLERAKQESLGLANFNAVYSFVYVGDRQIRHEILVPLRTLEVLDRPDSKPTFLTPAEQETAAKAISEFFAEAVAMSVDGEPVEVHSSACQFFGLDVKDPARSGNGSDVSLVSGRVGVTLAYTLPRRPTAIEMQWNQFAPSWRSISSVVVDGDAISKHVLSRIGNRNRLSWSAAATTAPVREELRAIPAGPPRRAISTGRVSVAVFLLVAIVGLAVYAGPRTRMGRVLPLVVVAVITFGAIVAGSLGASPQRVLQTPLPVAEAECQEIFRPLHRQVYAAMKSPDDEAIYDALATAVSGELLEQTYRRMRESLAMPDEGGAIANVESIEIAHEQSQQRQPDLFSYRCRWIVIGAVEHWGHLHRRKQAHEAVFQIQDVDGFWKIVAWDLLDEESLGTTVTVK